MIKTIFTFIISSLLIGGGLNSSTIKAANKGCGIIPQPLFVEENSGQVFNLTNKVIIGGDDLFSNEIHFLQKELLEQQGLSLSINNNYNSETQNIQFKYNSALSSEAYTIDMEYNKIELCASDTPGMFNAVMSLMQLVRLESVKNGTIQLKCWKIEDKPKYGWRGLMLDEARHFFGKQKVKQILDWMATYKLNHFHWHLTDSQGWRLEIKQYPLLAMVGGIGTYTNPNAPAQYYKQEEIKEIIQYAKERHITVIPEIDMPGHAAAANKAYPEYSGGGSKTHPEFTFNPGKEETYQYLTNILKEIDVLFPSQMIHIGGDEVHYGNEKWPEIEDIKQLIKKEKLANMKDVEKYFFERMADTLININNKVLAWDEVADSKLNPDNTIIFFWRHNRPEQLQKALDKNVSVVICPRHPMYFDYVQDTIQHYGPDWKKFSFNSLEKIYNFKKEDFDVEYPQKNKVLGIQANLWTERIQTPQRLDYMLFPRMAALSESVWCENKENFPEFENRLKAHFKLFEKGNVYYSNPYNRELTGEPKK